MKYANRSACVALSARDLRLAVEIEKPGLNSGVSTTTLVIPRA